MTVPEISRPFGCFSLAGRVIVAIAEAASLWRWLGIEFDMRTAASPPGTRVLARVDPHVRHRPGLRGEMTYYERGGAKVFAAGTLNFPAALVYPQFRLLLENLWARLSTP